MQTEGEIVVGNGRRSSFYASVSATCKVRRCVI